MAKSDRLLGRMILESDTVVFVLSPESVKSEICVWEVAEATRLSKRVFPVVAISLEGAPVPAQLQHLNYIYFFKEPSVPESGFGHGLARLLTALKVDVEWLREHKNLLVRAEAWEARGQDPDRLMRGSLLIEAEQWLLRRPLDAPDISPLQRAFLDASRQAEDTSAEALRRQLDAMAQAQQARQSALAEAEAALAKAEAEQVAREREARGRARLQRVLIAVGFGAALALGGFGVYSLSLQRAAEAEALRAQSARSEAQRQRALAVQNEKTAKEERDNALVTQSLYLADISRQNTRAHNYTVGVLLGLEALPEDAKNPKDRPFVGEAAATLDRALRDQRERFLFGTLDDTASEGSDTVPRGSPPSFGQDGRHLLTLINGKATLWDTASGSKITDVGGDNLTDAVQSPDSHRAFVRSKKIAALWNLDTGTQLAKMDDKASSPKFSPDGALLALVRDGDEGTLDIYETAKGTLRQTLALKPFGFNNLSNASLSYFASNSSLLVWKGDYSFHAVVWDITSNRPLFNIEVPSSRDGDTFWKQHGTIVSIMPSPSGETIFLVARKTVWILSGRDGSIVNSYPVPWKKEKSGDERTPFGKPDDSSASILSVHAASQRMALGEHGEPVRVLDLKTGKVVQTLRFSASIYDKIVFAPDGQTLAITTGDPDPIEGYRAGLQLWELNTSQRIATLVGPRQRFGEIVFSSDGRQIATTTRANDVVRLWSARPARGLLDLSLARSAEFVAKGRHVLTTLRDGPPLLLDAISGEAVATLSGHTDKITGVWPNASRDRIATASKDKTVRVWDAENGRTLTTLKGHTNAVVDATFADDGAIVTASEDGTVRLWEIATGRELDVFAPGPGGGEPLLEVIPSNGNRYIAIKTKNESIIAFDRETRSRVALDQSNEGLEGLSWVRFSAANRSLIAKFGSVIRIWSLPKGELLASVNVQPGTFSSTLTSLFDSKNTLLAYATPEASVEIWDIEEGKKISDLKGHLAPVNSLAFDASGTRLATASDDASARVWDVATGRQLAQMVHPDTVNDVEFSADGAMLYSTCEDQATRAFDAVSGNEIRTFGTPAADQARGGVRIRSPSPLGVKVRSLNGKARVLTLYHDTWRDQLVARLWDGETGTQLSSLDTGDSEYSLSGDLDVKWNPDKTSVLFKGLQNNKLWIWPIPPEAPDLIEKARQAVPRCLTPDERSHFGLLPKPPLWCIQLGKTPYRYRLGIELKESNVSPGDDERKKPRKAVVNVAAVTPGLPAEAAGLKPNDIIMAINGELPTDMNSALLMISELRSNKTAVLKIKRGETMLDIDIVPRF